ncbi:MAG: phosphodiesterase [Alphaproteobacteria bacterium]|nr:phosphodiesterase [Alphaproteobacteria bacterium]
MLIAQITDLHIREEGVLCYRRVDTAPFLMRAVDTLNQILPRPDIVLLTGDLIDAFKIEEYRRLRGLLDRLRLPYALIPGNHDARAGMRAVFGDQPFPKTGFIQYTIEHLPLRLIGLDTLVEGEHRGQLCAQRLDWLEARLAEQPERPTVIFMHHPPFTTGITPMDKYNLEGRERLAELVTRHANVERILCGHLHRSIQCRIGRSFATTCPATAHQVALGLGEAGVWGFTMEPPGYQLHYWIEGQGLVTHTGNFGDYAGPYSFRDGSPIELPRAAV